MSFGNQTAGSRVTLLVIIASFLTDKGWLELLAILAAACLDSCLFLWISWKVAGGRYDVLQPGKQTDHCG